jgi:hypothetical protein
MYKHVKIYIHNTLPFPNMEIFATHECTYTHIHAYIHVYVLFLILMLEFSHAVPL